MAAVGVAIPTRGRSAYLEVTLASIVAQARAHDAWVLVVLDGADPESEAVARHHGAEVISLAAPSGANAARNAAIDHAAATGADAVIFIDDDIEAPPGWLGAYVSGLERYPQHEVFGGPITAWLEGGGPAHCGAEPAPISTLDLGSQDADARYVWSANMAIRGSALRRVGHFQARLHGRGEEEEWLDRFAAEGGRVRYLAGAGLRHRRAGADARLTSLTRAGYRLGLSARANDVRKGTAPTLTHELRDLAGAVFHLSVKRCSYGAVFAGHSLGRIRETLSPSPAPVGDGEFTSGRSGYVAGRRALSSARVRDYSADLATQLQRRRLSRDAAAWGVPRRVEVLALEREDVPNILDAAVAELTRSRHLVRVRRSPVASRGRFENLNRLLDRPADTLRHADWLIVIDDDVALPPGFLDQFLFLAERHRLTLAQPAHRRLSHAAWPVTRRRAGSAVRETGFVEIGPMVAFQRESFPTLLPFPELRVGWGVDAYWAAVAAEQGWRMGVIDATPISHVLRPIATSYDQSAALAESREFLAGHPHITPTQADRTLQTHRSW